MRIVYRKRPWARPDVNAKAMAAEAKANGGNITAGEIAWTRRWEYFAGTNNPSRAHLRWWLKGETEIAVVPGGICGYQVYRRRLG